MTARAELDEAAARAIDCGEREVDGSKPCACCRLDARAAVDAILPLIADAIEAEADRRRAGIAAIVGRELTHDPASSCYLRVAARLVRQLLTVGQDGE